MADKKAKGSQRGDAVSLPRAGVVARAGAASRTVEQAPRTAMVGSQSPADPRPGTLVRIDDARNALGYAVTELEQALSEIGVATHTTYGDARNAPREAAPQSGRTVIEGLRDLRSEAQSVQSRIDEFVYGEDREDCCADSDGAEDSDEKRSKVAAENTTFGRDFLIIQRGTVDEYSAIHRNLSRIEDSLLSRPSNGQEDVAKAEPAPHTESVIELIENVEDLTNRLVTRIHNLVTQLRSTF